MSYCDQSKLLSYSDWKSNQMNVMLSAELDRAAAERLANETKRYIDEMKQSSNEMDKLTNFSLQRRREEIRYWQTELNMKLEQIKLSVADLLSIDRRLDKAYSIIQENLKIILKCIETRGKRQSVYLVYDAPEKHLCKERQIIEGVLALHCKTKQEIHDQLRLLRKLRYDLEKDLLKRITLFDVEMENNEMQRKKDIVDKFSFEVKQSLVDKKPDCNEITKGMESSPIINMTQWITQAKKVFAESEKQRQNSTNLTSIVNNSIQETKDDLQNIKIASDDSFTERITELREHKSMMEDHLQKVNQQIQDLDSATKGLIEQIWVFNKRIALEECKLKGKNGSSDKKENLDEFLTLEYNKSKDNVEKLKDNLSCIQCSLKGLQKRKAEIEKDLGFCTESLRIDDYECMPMRQNIKYFIF